ncbi:ABC transporter permease [Bifidobacterium boum]|uniref:ABC transporter permease n=1 Tax=Bifidobacterium boum TaxID=78343 RepID=UPI003F92D116
MRFSDLVHLCRQNLFRRKSRTILTVLGVVVGCCSIVTMVSLGSGIDEQNKQMLASMGDLTIITVTGTNSTGGMQAAGPMGMADSSGTATARLDDKAVKDFRSLQYVAAATGHITYPSARLTAGPANRYTSDAGSIEAIDMDQFDAMGYKLVSGHKPERQGEALAGQYTAYDFMDSLRPEGDNYRVAPMNVAESCTAEERANGCRDKSDVQDPFFNILTTKITMAAAPSDDSGTTSSSSATTTDNTASASGSGAQIQVSGLLKEDYGKGQATLSGLLMDIGTLKDLVAKIQPGAVASSLSYDSALVRVQDIDHVADVESQIRTMGFTTSSSRDMLDSLKEQTRSIQLILGGIGAVALVVAAIGIANTMVMSVTERVREIGIMKALGCTVHDIRAMFLVEAGAIGVIGGVIGCLVSAVISLAINLIRYGGVSTEHLQWAILGNGTGNESVRISVIPWWLYVFAIAFATLISLISGFGPANKAVRVPALDAIKSNQ